jgi:ADP-ribose pyrophosphatase
MSSKTTANWKVLKSKFLYNEPWLTIREEIVELPNGARIPSYYIFDYPDWVNVIAITKEKKFVFIKQYRHGLGRADFELSAGVRDKEDETTLAAAKRELMEETGYGNGTWSEYMTISANPATHANLTYCFLAVDVEKLGEQSLDASEDISVHLFSAQEVKALLESGKIMQSLMAAPLWKYVAENHL